MRKKANIKANVFEYSNHSFEAVRQFDLLEIELLYTPEKAEVVNIENWDYADFYAMANIIPHQEVNFAYADIFLMDSKYYVVACFEHLYYYIGKTEKTQKIEP